jgi:hypothetical protein
MTAACPQGKVEQVYIKSTNFSYSFGNKLNRNGPPEAKFQNWNVLIFHRIIMIFFFKMIIFMS